jgi:hypothetical protein
MARQMLAVVGILVVAAACSASRAEPSTTVPVPSSTAPIVTTTTTTVATPVSFEVPRLASIVEEPNPLPIRVFEDALLHVDGPCVTAETGGKTILLIIDFRASISGSDVRFDGFFPGVVPTRVLSSGSRYQLRGVPDPFEAELAEPLPPGCEYDERMILLGALDAPVGHGLRTFPVEVWEGVPTIGINSTTITIDGACTTVSHSTGESLVGESLVIWPAGTVSLLDDHTIHMSRWETLGEVVVRSGDTIGLFGAHSDFGIDDPPPDCEYDGIFVTVVLFPPRE